jgi:hypothetical protein
MKKRLFPYGGIIRIRFNGSDLSLSAPLSKRRQKYIFFEHHHYRHEGDREKCIFAT